MLQIQEKWKTSQEANQGNLSEDRTSATLLCTFCLIDRLSNRISPLFNPETHVASTEREKAKILLQQKDPI